MSSMNYVPQIIVYLTLTMCYIPVLAHSGKITWSDQRISLDVQQGNTVIKQLDFSVKNKVEQAYIDVTPSINGVASIIPQQFEVLLPGITYTVQLVIEPATQIGMHAGTVHVRNKNSTIPDTLKVKINITEDNSDDGYVSLGKVSLTGVDLSRFNSTSDTIGFSLTDAIYSNQVQIYHQGWPVSDTDVTIDSNMVIMEPRLVSGKNEIILVANDTEGKLIYEEFILWAGNRTLQGYVIDENYNLVQDATVVIKLGDDQTVTNDIISSDGYFSFDNLPSRTVTSRIYSYQFKDGISSR